MRGLPLLFCSAQLALISADTPMEMSRSAADDAPGEDISFPAPGDGATTEEMLAIGYPIELKRINQTKGEGRTNIGDQHQQNAQIRRSGRAPAKEKDDFGITP
ncbi:hypothetical protein niasHT_026167 [Heterodera trifolii]|uniref:Uncharacterized protein n=1 Tax=Heterodera trifolii TaxID=157864 RepID=A0ABD2K1K8_9BILA